MLPFLGEIPISSYYTWIVLFAENWGGGPAGIDARSREVLRGIERTALNSLGAGPAGSRRRLDSLGVELALPAGIPPGKIAVQFINALHRAVVDHDVNCGQEEKLRLRVAIDIAEPGQSEPDWTSLRLAGVRDLADSPVIGRVLTAETRNPVALIGSAQWYASCVGAGHALADGYREVWVAAGTYLGSAWVKVPGRSTPPGLMPADDPPSRPSRSRAGAAGKQGVHQKGGAGSVSNVVEGGNHETVIQVGVVNDGVHVGNRYHGTDHRTRDGGR